MTAIPDNFGYFVPPSLPRAAYHEGPTRPQVSGDGTLQEQFELFHSLNPWVYDHLVRLTRDLKDRGVTKVGMGMLFEVLRWQFAMTTSDPNSEFKLNNNHRSRYARRIMEDHPDLMDIYETRKLTAL